MLMTAAAWGINILIEHRFIWNLWEGLEFRCAWDEVSAIVKFVVW
jgi:hypothetical protein